MKLSDVISFMSLNVYAEIAMVIFLGVFVVIVYRVLRMPKSVTSQRAMIPLSDDPVEPVEPKKAAAQSAPNGGTQ